MGSWNVACGITSMPIIRGEKAKVFIIMDTDIDNYTKRDIASGKTDFGGHRCIHSGTLWCPIMFPITGIYNEYGSLENIEEDENTDWIVKWFKEQRKEKGVLISDRHAKYDADDKTADPLSNIYRILEVVERGNIRVRQFTGNFVPLSLMFVRDDVYKLALETVSTIEIFYGGFGVPSKLLEQHSERAVKFLQEQEDRFAKCTGEEPKKISPTIALLDEEHNTHRRMPHDVRYNVSERLENKAKESYFFDLFLMEFSKYYTPSSSQPCDHYGPDNVVKFQNGVAKIAKKIKKNWDDYCKE
jgi:hypothetical protein